MPIPPLLTDPEIAAGLPPGWAVEHGQLHRSYVFKDFVGAFGFMSGAALMAQRMDHHPDWSNVYNRVTIALSTHESGGITHRDLALAVAMEDLARRLA